MANNCVATQQSHFTKIILSAVVLSVGVFSGCAEKSYDNAYELWQAVEPHVDCPEGNLRISQEPEGDTFPPHTFAICTPADISGTARIETITDDTYGFFLGVRVVDNPREADALTEPFLDASHTIVGDGWAVGVTGPFTDDAEIILESWLEEVQEDIGGEIQ